MFALVLTWTRHHVGRPRVSAARRGTPGRHRRADPAPPVRRDVDRLRTLGHPVHATAGTAGWVRARTCRRPGLAPPALRLPHARRDQQHPHDRTAPAGCTPDGAGTSSAGTSTARAGAPTGSTASTRARPRAPAHATRPRPGRLHLAGDLHGGLPLPVQVHLGPDRSSPTLPIRCRPAGSTASGGGSIARRSRLLRRRHTTGPRSSARASRTTPMSRTTNSFGKHPEELATSLGHNRHGESTYRSPGAAIVDGGRPLGEGVDAVLAATRARRTLRPWRPPRRRPTPPS